ncbi:hypothetical protein FHS57_000187 [Runella defluvii]|uniref:Putative restriction endonuclease domain-containing protein n=1 Tax=Runella defluvii TaxID=370973 RepID=A0A7W6EN62_9BACT|nr:Uma2 family endonuclease [Runella defluvii]MBB3836205.1 hypothetical protein [Runella defluvii]
MTLISSQVTSPVFFFKRQKGVKSNSCSFGTEEVLSESSINTDRVTKLAEYTQLPTLEYYLIIEQEECLVEVFNREGKRWYVEFYSDINERIDLPALNIQLPLSVIYKKVQLPTSTDESNSATT